MLDAVSYQLMELASVSRDADPSLKLGELSSAMKATFNFGQ